MDRRLARIGDTRVINYTEGMPILGRCYIADMPASVYHATDCISNSGLKLISRSPAHFKYAPKRESTRSMVIGSALHQAVLEPDLFFDTYVMLHDAEDRRCKDYKDAKEEFGEEFVLVASECAKIEGIMGRIQGNKEVQELLSLPGHNELSGFSTDPETGVMCRHRFDKLTNNGIGIDLKTTTDARPDAFSRSIMNYGYHMQAAFYVDNYEWITGKQLDDFVFIVVESESPYAVKMYRLGQESYAIGREQYRNSLLKYHECRATDFWPAYESQGIEEISIPQWAINQYDFEQVEGMTFTDE